MQKYKIRLTSRDRLLRAWQNTTELVRDLGFYIGEEGEESELGQLFSFLAVREGENAARLLEALHTEEKAGQKSKK